MCGLLQKFQSPIAPGNLTDITWWLASEGMTDKEAVGVFILQLVPLTNTFGGEHPFMEASTVPNLLAGRGNAQSGEHWHAWAPECVLSHGTGGFHNVDGIDGWQSLRFDQKCLAERVESKDFGDFMNYAKEDPAVRVGVYCPLVQYFSEIRDIAAPPLSPSSPPSPSPSPPPAFFGTTLIGNSDLCNARDVNGYVSFYENRISHDPLKAREMRCTAYFSGSWKQIPYQNCVNIDCLDPSSSSNCHPATPFYVSGC